MSAAKGSTREKTSDKVKEPKQYEVVMHNDDFTTMEFVVGILTDIFHKDRIIAETLMLDVHNKGSAVVGKYAYDIAVTRTNKAMTRAKESGFPFKMTIREA